jgi:hypothetical protein
METEEIAEQSRALEEWLIEGDLTLSEAVQVLTTTLMRLANLKFRGETWSQ